MKDVHEKIASWPDWSWRNKTKNTKKERKDPAMVIKNIKK